jgi:phosphoglycerol geranylgeranyltransferase
MNGRVLNEMYELYEKGKKSFIHLIDPADDLDNIGKLVKKSEEAGFFAISVGGSFGAQGEILDETIKVIKENCSLPVILFPGNTAGISKYADAIFFMSLLNSNDPYWISGAQIAAAFPVKRLGIEVIPTSYVVIEPGMAVGWVGRVQPIPRNVPYIAAACALAGQYIGSKVVIFDSGSGAPEPMPPEMVKYAASNIEIPIIVGGGVRRVDQAEKIFDAGATFIQVGNVLEGPNADKVIESFKSLIRKY